MERYVITGGPCSGKTTTCKELASLGYEIVQESARIIIAEEQQKTNGVLPWTNLFEFQKLVLRRQLDLESRINGQPTFLDRGFLDGVAYCWQGKVKVPEELLALTKTQRYNRVFLLDPLPNYQTDGQRKEDITVAAELHRLIGEAYKEFGYDVIKVPVLEPKQRAQNIIKKFSEVV